MSTEAAATSAQSTNNAGAAHTTDVKPAAAATPTATPAAATPSEVKTLVTDGDVGSGEASGGDPAKPAATDDKPVVPEKYELKLSEQSPLSDASIQAISEYAKEKGLSNEQAQELLVREEQAVTGYVKDLHSQHNARVESWVESVKSDKELGGDNFKESVHRANLFVKKYGTEQFIKELKDSGFGNHPEVVRIFARAGRDMANDKLVTKGAEAQPEKSVAQVFYPNQNQ